MMMAEMFALYPGEVRCEHEGYETYLCPTLGSPLSCCGRSDLWRVKQQPTKNE